MRKTRFSGLVAAAAAAALASALPGCGTCVEEGDRLEVEVRTSPSLNDLGSGPQHVRFRVWAVKSKAMFDGKRAEDLAEADVGPLEASQLGRAFPSESDWIRPADARRLYLPVDLDDQYTHVGIAVLYPVARKELVALDCRDRKGYAVVRPAHRAQFLLDRSEVRVGGE